MTYSELLKDTELYSDVINALGAGYSEVGIAEQFDLDLDLILEVRRKHNAGVKQRSSNRTVGNLDNVLAELVKDNTRALNSINKVVNDPSYVISQKAGDLGVLYEKIGNFTVRLLEAAAEAQRKNSEEGPE